jgi:hypothetical protein
MGCKGIQVSPETVRFNRNVASGATARPFENCMFDEVADAIELGGLVARAAAHPDSSGH